ncbi:MAG TPA: hypothetical protein VIL71_08640 [Spirillospora sp.]
MTRSDSGHDGETPAPQNTAPQNAHEAPGAVTTGPVRLTISWIIVGVPLAYGVVETVRAVVPLFGG